MLKNYIKIAFRNLVKGKLYSVVNIAGLAAGIVCCIFILLYINKELSYDTFHNKADRIFRINNVNPDNPEHVAWLTNPIGHRIKEGLPEVESMTQISGRYADETIVSYDDQRFYEKGFIHATPSLFEIFDFPVLIGDPLTSLQEPYTVFISGSMAQKYFPNQDPLGEVLEVNNEQTYTIAGVFRDIPDNSHIRFQFVASMESKFESGLDRDHWFRGGAYTYVLLQKEADPEAFHKKLENYRDYVTGPDESREDEYGYYESLTLIAVPLLDIHLYTSFTSEMIPQGDITYIYLFSAIALLILLIACINYMNLATARASKRAQEIGIRKATGGSSRQLVMQYLCESYLIVLIALIFAILLAESFLPVINYLMDRSMDISWSDPGMLALLAGLWLVTGFGAGAYPAFYLSGFRSVHTLRGMEAVRSSGRLRKILVTFQLAISVVLIISTIIIQRQMQLVRLSQPGVDQEQIVMIPTRDQIGDRYSVLRERLLQSGAVQSVTTTSFEPGEPGAIVFFPTINVEDTDEGSVSEEYIIMDRITVDYDFIETFGLELEEGRWFSRESGTNSSQSVIINETAARQFGWEEPVGKSIGERRVIGMLKDFHYKSLKEEVVPMIIYPRETASRFIFLKLPAGDIFSVMQTAQATWNEVIPEVPFYYTFLDEAFDALYRTELRLNTLITAFAVLAILIACLGLLGLAAFTAEQRTKEIGIRKVLGASVHQVVALLTRDFMKWGLLGVVLAIPVAHYMMTKWLYTFTYRVDIGIGTYLVAGVIVIILILLAVSWQSVKAAVANPVEALRSE